MIKPDTNVSLLTVINQSKTPKSSRTCCMQRSSPSWKEACSRPPPVDRIHRRSEHQKLILGSPILRYSSHELSQARRRTRGPNTPPCMTSPPSKMTFRAYSVRRLHDSVQNRKRADPKLENWPTVLLNTRMTTHVPCRVHIQSPRKGLMTAPPQE